MQVEKPDSAASEPPSGPVPYYFSQRSKLALIAACYFVVGKFGLQFAYLHESASAIWPATGLAFAALLLWGVRLWPAIFIGAFFVNITTAGSALTALLIATGNTLEAVTGAWLALRYARGRHAFARARDVVRFWFLSCMLAALLSATIGVSGLCLTRFAPWSDFIPLWRTWWLGDAVGGFIGAAVILCWVAAPPLVRDRQRIFEGILVFAFIALVGTLVFNNQRLHQTMSVLPAMLWAAFRLGRRLTATAVLVLAAIGTWGTLRGTGPFAGPLTSPNDALLALQSYLGVLAVTHMTIASVVAERRRAELRLRDARDELERRVADRTALLSTANTALRQEMAERRLAEDRLMAAERQRGDDMRDLAVFVQGAQEEERRRVARDLHDDLGQRLAALKLNMQLFEQELSRSGEPYRRRLMQLVEDVDRVIGEVRRLSYNLRPLALDDFGLNVAIEMLCKEFEKMYKIGTQLHVNGSEPLFRDAQIDIALYRVAQGALANVARHAGAHNVRVTLSNDDHTAALVVEDDGHGFDVKEMRRRRDSLTGLGLIGMRERAELLGGSFDIYSSPERGTRVEVKFPTGRADPAPEA